MFTTNICYAVVNIHLALLSSKIRSIWQFFLLLMGCVVPLTCRLCWKIIVRGVPVFFCVMKRGPNYISITLRRVLLFWRAYPKVLLPLFHPVIFFTVPSWQERERGKEIKSESKTAAAVRSYRQWQSHLFFCRQSCQLAVLCERGKLHAGIYGARSE